MSVTILLLLALGLGLAGWLAGRARAWSFRRSAGAGALAALPSYHAWYVALWIVVPMVVFIAAWSVIGPQLVSQHVLASPAAADLPAEAITRYEAREGGETAELDAAVVPKEPAAPPPTAWVKKDMELEVAPLINS